MVKKVILIVALIFGANMVLADNDVFTYYLKYSDKYGKDTVAYCGITNDPEARVIEHVKDRTLRYNTFDAMVVFAGPMSRKEALQEETRCIYNYPIPSLYQTQGGNAKEEEERRRDIAEYESRYDTSRLVQTQDPKVIYTSSVSQKLKSMASMLKSVMKDSGYDDKKEETPPVCEKCHAKVSDGIASYCKQNFGGHIYCMNCQKYQTACDYKREAPPVCEKCHSKVSEGVVSYCKQSFGGHIYCMNCQKNQTACGKK